MLGIDNQPFLNGKEVKFADGAWVQQSKFKRDNIPVRIRRQPRFQISKSLRYWEPSKEKMCKAYISELVPVPASNGLIISQTMFGNFIKLLKSEEEIAVNLECKVIRLLASHLDQIKENPSLKADLEGWLIKSVIEEVKYDEREKIILKHKSDYFSLSILEKYLLDREMKIEEEEEVIENDPETLLEGLDTETK